MRQRSCSMVLVTLMLAATSANASHLRRGPTSAKHKHGKQAKSTHASQAAASKPRAIDDTRATEIQTALVKAGYLQEVTGHWDSTSQAAMQKLQADNGWQTKMIPDSRALIKLGLGPGAQPQTARPPASQTVPSSPASGA